MSDTIPAPEVFRHRSGLTVIHQHNPLAPVVALQMWVHVGSGDETEREAGLAHVHEHMLFKGTERRGVGEIARDVEAYGGQINAWTSFDHTVYHLIMPSRFAEEGLDVLFDAMWHSAFDADELERELEVIQEEIRRGLDMPTRVLTQSLFETSFAVHPYGRPVIGTPQSVAAFTRDDILAFYQRWYRPENMALVVVGDIDRADLVALIDQLGVPASGDELVRTPRATEPPQRELRTTVHTADITDAHVNLAFHVPELTHPDTPALEVLTMLLGQGDSSLLFEHVQRAQGLTNSVYSYLYSPSEPGMTLVGASFRGDDEGPGALVVLEAVVREIAHLRHRSLSPSDVRRAVRQLESDAIYQRQTVQGVAQRVGYFHTVAGDIAFEQTFIGAASSVTPADLLDVASRYLTPSNLTVGFMLPDGADVGIDHATIEATVQRIYAEVDAEYEREPAVADEHGVVMHRFDDGLTVIVQRDATAPMFAARAAVLGGLLAEDASTSGANNLIAELMLSGTTVRTASELAREIDDLAASMAGFSGRNSLGLRMTALSQDFDQAMDIFADVLFDSTLPEDELRRIRAEVISEIGAQRDNVAAAAFQEFSEALYPHHPYALPPLGTAESVSALERDALLAYYHGRVRPEHMVVTIVGDVDPAHAIDTVAALFDRARGRAAVALPEHAAPPMPTEPVRVEDTRDRQQAHIVLGYRAPSMFDADRHALDLLAAILGGQGGRLFVELRDRQSLAYSVGAYATPGYDVGSFAFYIATSPEKVDQAISSIRAEAARIVDEGVTADELERAQRLLMGRRAISEQRQSARAAYFGFDELYGLGYAHGFDHAAQLEAVTLDEVRDVAARYLRPDAEVLVVIRPSVGTAPAE